MPWLAGTALLHCAVVMEKREALKVWTVLLAILAFSLSLMGTFLVRSGVLTSVHAFAVDPQRGIFILAIMTVFTGGGLALFALRARNLRQGGIFAPISREGALVLNNILLTTACATVLIGTLYPLLLEALTGAKISVGPPYFNMTFGPLMLPLLIALPFGPLLAWKRGDILGAAQRLMFAAVLAVVVLVLAYATFHRGPILAPFGLALGVFVMLGAMIELTTRVRLGEVPWRESLRRLKGQPRSAFGTTLAHFGVGLMVVGIVATSAYREEKILVMKAGETTQLAGYALTFRGAAPRTGPNYREEVGSFDVMRDGNAITVLEPSKRIYDVPPQPTSESGIHAAWRGDLYVVLGDKQKRGGFTVRIFFNPLVRFIWIGALIMFLGGAVSLSDRRLRVGAPRRTGRAIAPAPAE
jgi:cytochrome c-type biogenesis protein CcmF